MNISEFNQVLADVVDSGMTHVIAFELRRMSSTDRAKLADYYRHQAEDTRKNIKTE